MDAVTTTYSPDGLLARFREWTAPELPAARERVRAELAALRAARRPAAAATAGRDAQTREAA